MGLTLSVKKFHIGSKEIKDKILNPITKSLYGLGFNPLILTILSLICGLIAAFFLNTNYFNFVIFVLLGLLFDLLDGALARLTKTTSKFGINIDLITDNLSTLAILIAIYFNYQATPLLFYTIILSILEFTINPYYEKLLIFRSLRFHISLLAIFKLYTVAVWLKLIIGIFSFITVFYKRILFPKKYKKFLP